MSDSEVLDSLALGAALAVAPATIRASLEAVRAAGMPRHLDLSAVVVADAGRHHVAARAITALAGHVARCPIVTVDDTTLPRWANGTTVVLDLGDTIGLTAAAPVVGLAPAGPLPAPMAQVAAGLGVLFQCGALDAVIIDEVMAAADVVEARLAAVVADDAQVRRLARRIGRTMPLVYGAGAVGGAAAASWKRSFNRSAKVPAFANEVPGVDDDEVCGWAQHGDVTRQVFTLVSLRHGAETAEDARRLDVTVEICDEIVAGVHEARSAATVPVSALFDLMTLGELVALRLAADSDIDPGPVPILDLYR